MKLSCISQDIFSWLGQNFKFNGVMLVSADILKIKFLKTNRDLLNFHRILHYILLQYKYKFKNKKFQMEGTFVK